MIPSDIAGLKLWLAANAITGLSDGDPVTTWSDLSGLGNDATGTGTTRPLYKTTILNAKPIVRFDGSDDFLELTTNLDIPVFSIFVVYKKAGVGTFYEVPIVFKQAPLLARGAATDEWGIYVGGEVSSGTDINTFKITAIVARAANDIDLVSDGSLVTRTTGTSYATESRSLVGCNALGAAQQHWLNGDVAEIIVYDSALSTANREGIEAYLIDKWFTVPPAPTAASFRIPRLRPAIFKPGLAR